MRSRRIDEIGRMHLGPRPVVITQPKLDPATIRQIKTYEVGVPHPYSILDTNLPHQEAVHPSERELHELDIFGL